MIRALRCSVFVLAAMASACLVRAQAPRGAAHKAPAGKAQKLSNPLNDLLTEAQQDIERNDYRAAITPLQKFLTEQPDFAWAHFQLGYAYTALQKWDEARAEYQRAIELDPKLAEAQLNLGILLLERQPDAAVAPLRKAVELLPSQSRPRSLLARALERSGDIPGALEAYQGAQRLDPKDFDAVLAHATALFRANKMAEAEQKFREATALKHDSAEARLGLARSLDAQQKSEAAEEYGNYLELKPEDRDAHLRIARIAMREKRYDEALAELHRADAGQAPGPESLRARADIQVAQAHWDEAIGTLQKVLATAPDDAQLRAGLGRIYLQKRDFPAAQRELKAALRLNPNDLPALKDLSSAYYLAGDPVTTLTLLDEVARREAPAAGTWFIRATCYDKLGRPQKAMDAYQKFLDADKNEHPNQIWQAQQRIIVLRKVLEKKH